uniref:Uncharacterized protein n=1 Tax=Prymnesium polylepis TaxID=72548 RepID=A0A7S4HQD8_9EUKA
MPDATVPMGIPVAESAEHTTAYARATDDDDDECCGLFELPGFRHLLLCCCGDDDAPVANESSSSKMLCGIHKCWCCAAAVCAVVAASVWALCWVITANSVCDPKRLAGLTPPFDGALVPNHIWLEPHETWFSFSQQLDVRAADSNSNEPSGPRIGSFYDVRIPGLYFSLAFQDVGGRVWFTAYNREAARHI